MNEKDILYELSRCRKCRFCIDSCPIFRLFDNKENIGPYGRVQLLRHLLKGTFDVDDTILHSIYTCLTCAECNVACEESGGALEISELVRSGRNIVFDKMMRDELNTPEANLIKYALSTLVDNIMKKNDPVGLGGKYWIKWTHGLNINGKGSTILYTSRMYQMTPYLTEITNLMEKYKNMIKTGKFKFLIKLGSSLGVKFASIKADKILKDKGTKALRGIALALKEVGVEYAYLYDKEPYVGTLLYDLGVDEYLKEYIPKVYKLFKESNVEKVITVDPHTYQLVKIVYPEYIENYDIEAIHYSELLEQYNDMLRRRVKEKTKEKYVIHDPCTMSRKMNIISEPRSIAQALGIEIVEPKHSGKYTRCCGGPIEFAYPEYSKVVAADRVSELISYSQNVLTYCPICLMNLKKHIEEKGSNIYDLGELIYERIF